MAMALSRHGYDLADVRLGDGSGPIARLTVAPGGRPDALAEHVSRRAAYRGTFAPTDPARFRDLATALEAEGHLVSFARDFIRDVAKLADEAGAEFVHDPRYWRETWGWVRFSRSDPRWDRDGLNADSMALSGIERVLGRWLMAPPAFEVMRKLGLAGALLSERAKIESAGALVLFTAPDGEDPFVTGRAFYRVWLEVTRAGLALCPISALADSKRTNAEIRRRFAIGAHSRLVNVFRVGAVPAGFAARLTPRLPAADLVTAS
jgi:hypothetical protein